jgi:hypothetical protein
MRMPSFDTAGKVLACEADGASVTVAIEAFEAYNKGKIPTEALLLGHSDRGPYLTSWPHNASYYTFKVGSAGRLLVAVPAKAKFVIYEKSSCNAIL